MKDNSLDVVNGIFLAQAKAQVPEADIKRSATGVQTASGLKLTATGEYSVTNATPNNPLSAAWKFGVPVVNLGGKLTIGERVNVTATATVSEALSVIASSIYQSAGEFRLAHGSTLTATKAVTLEGGELITTTSATVAGQAILDAVIVGDLNIYDSTVTILKGKETDGVIGNLYVDGKVYFARGTFSPVLDCGVNGEPIPANEASPDRVSKFYSKGNFSIDAGRVTITPRKLNFTANLMRVGREWNSVIQSVDSRIEYLGTSTDHNDTVAGTNFEIKTDINPQSQVNRWKLAWRAL